jgi:hypothetical protein
MREQSTASYGPAPWVRHRVAPDPQRTSSIERTDPDRAVMLRRYGLRAARRCPVFSVLAAMSLLNRPQTVTHRLYAGVPATEVGILNRSPGYFPQTVGFVC